MSATGGAGRGSLPPKLYFRIGEVAGLVGVEPHVLRYWEREFRSIRPTKSAKGQRVYSRRDVENLLRVRELLYSEGFTIAGAKKRLLRTGVEPTPSASAAQPSPSPGKADTSPASSSMPALLVASSAKEPSMAAAASVMSAGTIAATSSGASAIGRTSSSLSAAAATSLTVHASHVRVREKLTALKSEVEAFLKELGG